MGIIIIKHYITEVENRISFLKKTNCAKSLYIYDRRMYIDRNLWNLYILRRSLRLFESSFSAYLTFSALSHLEILRPHTVADLNINLLAASLSNKVDFPLIELADINIISTAKNLDANDVFIYSAIIHILSANSICKMSLSKIQNFLFFESGDYVKTTRFFT